VSAGADPQLLAVDGGNSKTDVVLVSDTGAVLGRARGEGSNHQLTGIDAAMDAIDATVQAAQRAAGLDHGERPVSALGVYCLAGVDFDIDEQRLGEAIAARGWTAHSRIVNDTLAVSRAGVRAGWGIGVVCGTGINCAGIGPDGRVVRFPSLGELSGDFCPGGAWLGVRALGLALRAGDGRGEDTVLATAVPRHFGLAGPESLLEAVYTGDVPYSALFALAEVALDAAAAGDVVARRAVDQLADEVVAMVVAAVRRLGLASEAVEVVLGGGIFDTTDRGFLARVSNGVTAVAPRAVLRRLDAPPVVGAALLGLDDLGAGPAARALLRRSLGDDSAASIDLDGEG
jgi:N-acetylglucosamine kinase-like BadF-type ATPase